MSSKRNYPLFVIDNSRTHGRGVETDYISCTSNELPFVAAVTMHWVKEYNELYAPNDATAVWGDERNGIRLRIKVVSDLPVNYDKSTLRALLRRALKEVLIRKSTHTIDIDNVKNGDVVKWCDTYKLMLHEDLRSNPDDKSLIMMLGIMNKITSVFLEREDEE